MRAESVLGDRFDKLCRYHSYINGERLVARDVISKKIVPKARFIDVPCLCGSLYNDIPIASIDRWGLSAHTVLCKECGLIRLHPRWDDETYYRIYNKYYWQLANGNKDIDEKRFWLSVERSAESMEDLTQRVDITGKKILEIGCSYGAALFRLKNSGANKLVGYDYDKDVLELGRAYTELDLREGGLQGALDNGERYDVVILRHVFEHFLDPENEGRLLKKLISPQGYLFIEVPGVFDSTPSEWKRDLYERMDVFHSFYYSIGTLNSVLTSCGFHFVSGTERIYSLWSANSDAASGNTIQDYSADDVLKFLQKKEKARKLSASLEKMWEVISYPWVAGGYIKRMLTRQ